MRKWWIVVTLLLVAGTAFAQNPERYPNSNPVPVPRPAFEGGTLPVPHRTIGSVTVGERAPDFELENAAGGKRRLSEWRGGWVALWFGSRNAGISDADALAASVALDGVTVLMIARERTGMLRGWLEEHPGATAVLLSDVTADIACEYGAFDTSRGQPTPGFVLLDEEGVVRVAVMGVSLTPEDARKMVQIAKTAL